ncbi:hypothetical protein AVEN_212859-1 [Araneus ventricosus]|uniref:Uncharacterized protein n=1 Tax=Araneus ventricosus TaxID=182803 RepID=A0A4Y2U291_ARAVE|nr:hypothetical protein AVEN_143104-1 [Araneus ventricosus]GBO05781.1 hypothetical protein AVEN_212859-1 [Araneus ventricosus]
MKQNNKTFVQGEPFNRSEAGESKSIVKRGENIKTSKLRDLTPDLIVNPLKLHDVQNYRRCVSYRIERVSSNWFSTEIFYNQKRKVRKSGKEILWETRNILCT